MNIIAAEAAQSTSCPPGCLGHAFGPVHMSQEQTTTATAGPETVDIFVSLELAPGDTPAVRLQGAGDAPMQPEQAIALGQQLIVAGLAGKTVWAVTR